MMFTAEDFQKMVDFYMSLLPLVLIIGVVVVSFRAARAIIKIINAIAAENPNNPDNEPIDLGLDEFMGIGDDGEMLFASEKPKNGEVTKP